MDIKGLSYCIRTTHKNKHCTHTNKQTQYNRNTLCTETHTTHGNTYYTQKCTLHAYVQAHTYTHRTTHNRNTLYTLHTDAYVHTLSHTHTHTTTQRNAYILHKETYIAHRNTLVKSKSGSSLSIGKVLSPHCIVLPQSYRQLLSKVVPGKPWPVWLSTVLSPSIDKA